MNSLKFLTFIVTFAASVFFFQAVTFSADVMPFGDTGTTPVKPGVDVNDQVFSGVVKKVPDGAALVTSNATYLLTGGNFDGILDREVNIIGKVVKEGSIEKIEVAQAQLAHDHE